MSFTGLPDEAYFIQIFLAVVTGQGCRNQLRNLGMFTLSGRIGDTS